MRAYTRTRVYSTHMKNKINISKTGTEDESESHVHVEEKLGLSFSTDPVFTWINSVCSFSDWENTRSVRVRDQVIFCYDKNDKEAEKIAVVYLFREGWAQQQEFSEVFGYGTSTIRTWRQRIEREGLTGAARKKRRSPSLKLGGTKDLVVARLFHRGQSNVAIGRRLGVGEHAVRLALKRLGLKREKKPKEPELFSFSDAPGSESLPSEVSLCDKESLPSETASSQTTSFVDGEAEETDIENPECSEVEEDQETMKVPGTGKCPEIVPPNSDDANRVCLEAELHLPTLHTAFPSVDCNPEDREGDRGMAAIGKLNDATPFFRENIQCWGVGVLLTIPLILDNKILESFQKVYGRIPGFFGLRNSVMSLLFMTFLRVKRLEQLKEKNPSTLGALIGLDRLPETKTLRKKIKTMASGAKALELMRVLTHVRMKKQASKNLLGFLYVDGHVKEYHGLAKLGKTYVARRNCITKGSSDIWVNDSKGDPIFVVPCDLNQSLTKMLEKVLNEIKPLFGDRRPTIVFDRGGWKQALFQRLIDTKWDILTYRKGWKEKLQKEDFQKKSALINGKEVSYELHDMSVCIAEIELEDKTKKRYWMRQITRLKEGRQIPVMTTRQDLDAVELLFRMFNRWRQENFFKYAREEYLLDALWTYDWETIPEGFDRPNPEWGKRNKTLWKTRDELGKLLVTQRKLQDNHQKAVSNLAEAQAGFDPKTIRSLKGKISRQKKRLEDITPKIATKEIRIEKLRMDRDEIQKRIPATDRECLNHQMGLLSNSIKMLVYQIETELVDRLAKYYKRISKDGRKLIVAALQSEGRIQTTDKELYITLHKQSSPHRTKAIQALCNELNQMKVCFPGTQLKMQYDIA